MAKKPDKRVIFTIIAVILLIPLFIGNKEASLGNVANSNVNKSLDTLQAKWDMSNMVKENNLTQYIREESDFDYSNPEILKLAKEIKFSSETPYDAVKAAAIYTYKNVKYNPKADLSECFQETASLILKEKLNDCVGMTRVDVALLRAMGIPARSVGGCLKSTVRCTPLFAVAPGIDAQVNPMVEGDYKKRGQLHEWAEVFVPTKSKPLGEWLNLESTSGQIFSKTSSCDQYIIYAYDTNKYDRCVIRDNNFANLCSIS